MATKHIIPFNGSNYDTWARAVERHLVSHKDDLWDLIDDSNPKPVPASTPPSAAEKVAMKAWRKLNATAFEIIEATMLPEKRKIIQSLDSAKEAWDKVKEEASTESTLSIIHQIKGFVTAKLSDHEDMQAYLAEIDNSYNKLKDNGMVLPELFISYFMIDGLPEKYSLLKALLYDKPATSLTTSFVRTRLLEAASSEKSTAAEEAMLTRNRGGGFGGQQQRGGPRAGFKQDGRKTITCYHCNKVGHIARNCHTFKTAQWKEKFPVGNFLEPSSFKKRTPCDGDGESLRNG